MAYYLLFIGIFLNVISSCIINVQILQKLDDFLLIFAEQHRHPFFNSLAILLSKCGGMPAMLLIFSMFTLFFIHKKKTSAVYFLCLGSIGSIVIGWILKFLIDRPRPAIVSHLVSSYGSSYPSAHSLYAASLACITLYLIRHLSSSLRSFLLFFVGCWALMMGFSRIYLGVHYPSDVIGGWGLGCTWISLLWIVQNLNQKRCHNEVG